MIDFARFRINPVLAVAVFVLAGCAGTRVNDVVSSRASMMPPPRTIAVVTDVELRVPPRHESAETQAEAANQVNTALNNELRTTLQEHHLIVVDVSENPDLLLRSRVVNVRRGKKALRLLVGYGAGRAELRVDSRLELLRAPHAQPLLSFETRSTTGGMPGSLIGAAVKSLTKDGLEVEVSATVRQIDDQLTQHFVSQSWPYHDASSNVDTRSRANAP